MNTFTYPVVSIGDLFCIFHLCAFWNSQSKRENVRKDRHWITWYHVFSFLRESKVLHPRRIEAIKKNKELAKNFLKRVYWVDALDERSISTLQKDAGNLKFVLRGTSNQMINCNRLRPQELFETSRLFLSNYGYRSATVVADFDEIKRLVTMVMYMQWLADWKTRVPTEDLPVAIAVRTEKLNTILGYSSPEDGS